ncbi:diguanylate cyclase [Clostridium bovifaecis]|uniref:Diguanylate cyclase n=1 Tax=Clostridium bovifaecis TaxID=2184719 RepID=A0A6I6EN07_9CLOT|nr:diguanylate cyclase [Clostridium bovifaecis]
MKIAMPKDGEVLDQHFGKSRSFAIVALEGNEIVNTKEVSTESLQHNHGGLANMLENEGVSLVITGGIGAGAYKSLEEKGFKVIRGVSGKIGDVINEYLKGALQDKEVTCSHDHGEHHHY